MNVIALEDNGEVYSCIKVRAHRPTSPTLQIHRLIRLMGALCLITTALAVARPFALPSGYDQYAPRTQFINWKARAENISLGCAHFEVPLDWHNDSVDKAALDLIRYPTPKQPKLGSLFVNPGGSNKFC